MECACDDVAHPVLLTDTIAEDGQVRQWSVHAMMLPTLYSHSMFSTWYGNGLLMMCILLFSEGWPRVGAGGGGAGAAAE